MSVQDVDQHFIRPMVSFFRIDAADEGEFLRSLTDELAGASVHALQSAAQRFKRTRKYKTFPSLAECLETVSAVEPVAKTDRDELGRMEAFEAARGRAYVAKDSPNWPLMVERFKRLNGGRRPPVYYCRERNSNGWHFPREWVENPADSWAERRINIDERKETA